MPSRGSTTQSVAITRSGGTGSRVSPGAIGTEQEAALDDVFSKVMTPTGVTVVDRPRSGAATLGEATDGPQHHLLSSRSRRRCWAPERRPRGSRRRRVGLSFLPPRDARDKSSSRHETLTNPRSPVPQPIPSPPLPLPKFVDRGDEMRARVAQGGEQGRQSGPRAAAALPVERCMAGAAAFLALRSRRQPAMAPLPRGARLLPRALTTKRRPGRRLPRALGSTAAAAARLDGGSDGWRPGGKEKVGGRGRRRSTASVGGAGDASTRGESKIKPAPPAPSPAGFGFS